MMIFLFVSPDFNFAVVGFTLVTVMVGWIGRARVGVEGEGEGVGRVRMRVWGWGWGWGYEGEGESKGECDGLG